MDRQSIHIRLPRSLHDRLKAAADDQDISLNSLVLSLLAGSVGFSLDGTEQVAAPLESGPPKSKGRR
jgi:HicB-like protein involved in pilus formation